MSDNDNAADTGAKSAPKKPRTKKASAENGTGAPKAPSRKTASPKQPATVNAEVATPGASAEPAPQAAPAPQPAPVAAAPRTAMSTAASIPTPATALSAAAEKVSAMIPDTMTGKARDVAIDVKDKASDAVQSLARIISDSAGAIDDNVGPKYGDYARSAAQSVNEAAERLRAKPVDEIAEDTREFVRTKPAAALGIAAVASLILAKIFGSVFGKRR